MSDSTTTEEWVRQWVGGKWVPLVPDLTPPEAEPCGTTHERSFICTRRPGHTGRHAAGDGAHVIAAWSTASRRNVGGYTVRVERVSAEEVVLDLAGAEVRLDAASVEWLARVLKAA